MAITIPTSNPLLVGFGRDNKASMRGVVPEGATAFLSRALVVTSSGALVPLATDAVSIWGQSPDASKGSATGLPNDNTRPPFTINQDDTVAASGWKADHSAYNLADCTLEITITNNANPAASTAVQSNAVIGTSYGVVVATTTDVGMHLLDTTETTAKLFTVVGYVDGTGSTDINPRVLVKIVPSTII